MKLKKMARAGTLESNDIVVILEPIETDEVIIDLTSTVKYQYGESIVSTIQDLLNKYQVTGVKVTANDRGALDCTIEARVETALERTGIEVGI